jgi:hypothetical protein
MIPISRIILAFLVYQGFLSTASAQSNWTARTSGTTNNLTAVAYSGTQYVAVGASGTTLTSPDGVTWTTRTPATTTSINAITWTGTQFVAVGNSGAMLTTPDGVTWTARNTVTMSNMNGIAWSGQLLAAVGAGGTIVTSPDGVTWTARTSGTTTNLAAITWTGLIFVAVGNSGAILTSPDGMTWFARNTATMSNLAGVVSSGRLIVAVGAGGTTVSSPDGVAWLSQISGTTTNLWAITWTGAKYLAVGSSGAIRTSPTGTTWTGINTVTMSNLNGIALSSQMAVVVGANGTIVTSALDAPSAPVMLSPANKATGIAIPPTLSWNASATAASYRVQVSTDSNFSTLILNDSSVTTTSRAVTGLSNGVVYYWRVNAKNSGGTSAYFATWSFTIVSVPPTPTLLSPANNATNVPIPATLTWNASSGATSYRLQVSTDSLFSSTLLNDSTLTTTSKSVSNLVDNGTRYYWRVNAKNAGGTSVYSPTWHFNTYIFVSILPSHNFSIILSSESNSSLRFSLPQRCRILISLFDSQGRKVSQLLNETREPGEYTLPLPKNLKGSWNVLDFRAGDFHKTMKVQP